MFRGVDATWTRRNTAYLSYQLYSFLSVTILTAEITTSSIKDEAKLVWKHFWPDVMISLFHFHVWEKVHLEENLKLTLIFQEPSQDVAIGVFLITGTCTNKY